MTGLCLVLALLVLVPAVFGAVRGLGGFLIAAATDLPSGAVIVLVSSALLLGAAGAKRLRWVASD